MTEHFTLEEFCRSDKAERLGLDNIPSEKLYPAIKKTCEGLEKIRTLTGKPIVVLSGYRSPEVNKLVGGSLYSQHMRGEAADIVCPKYGSTLELALLIEEHMIALKIDQVIHEFNRWVHVSFSKEPRNQAISNHEDTGYTSGIS